MSFAVTAIVATGVAAGTSAYNSYQAGKDSKSLAGKKAALKEMEVQETLRVKQAEIDRTKSAQTVGFAKAGVMLQGTPLDVLRDTMKEGNLQKKNIRRTGDLQIEAIKASGRSAFNQGVMGAVGSIAGGVGQIGQLSYMRD